MGLVLEARDLPGQPYPGSDFSDVLYYARNGVYKQITKYTKDEPFRKVSSTIFPDGTDVCAALRACFPEDFTARPENRSKWAQWVDNGGAPPDAEGVVLSPHNRFNPTLYRLRAATNEEVKVGRAQ